MSEVRWPAGHDPRDAAIHVVNHARSAAPPAAVWSWLVTPSRWASYYSNATGLRHLAGGWPEMGPGTRFSWVTFGMRVTTEVTECEPFERLAWTGRGLSARGHHAWILTPRPDGGTDIRTEETQHGLLPAVVRPVHVRRMHQAHQRWVDGLARVSGSASHP